MTARQQALLFDVAIVFAIGMFMFIMGFLGGIQHHRLHVPNPPDNLTITSTP